VRLAGQHIAARCFEIGSDLMLMPAFGAYAGGLRTGADVFGALFDVQPRRHVLIYRNKLWAVD
jgi:metallophosphoesterase superfamily enzyme